MSSTEIEIESELIESTDEELDLDEVHLSDSPDNDRYDRDDIADLLNSRINKVEKKLLKSLPSEYLLTDMLPSELDELDKIMIENDKDDVQIIVKEKLGQRDVIIKISLLDKNYYFNEIIHEAFVGLFGLNKLNSKYFAKVIAANPVTLCPEYLDEINCGYVMYEFISGPTLDKYLTGCSTNNLKSILSQLFEALYMAYQELGFTHYDLHLSNIIVHTDEQGQIYPVIIDYGASHIIYNNIDYGRIFDEAKNYNRSMWMHDVFKILMFIYSYIDKTLVKYNMKNNLREEIEGLEYKIFRIKDLYLEPNLEQYLTGLKEIYQNRDGYDKEVARVTKNQITYKNKIIEYQQQIVELEQKGVVLPDMPYEAITIIRELLKFFLTVEPTTKWFKNYKGKYYTPNQEMMKTNYDFAKFMILAKKLLN